MIRTGRRAKPSRTPGGKKKRMRTGGREEEAGRPGEPGEDRPERTTKMIRTPRRQRRRQRRRHHRKERRRGRRRESRRERNGRKILELEPGRGSSSVLPKRRPKRESTTPVPTTRWTSRRTAKTRLRLEAAVAAAE